LAFSVVFGRQPGCSEVRFAEGEGFVAVFAVVVLVETQNLASLHDGSPTTKIFTATFGAAPSIPAGFFRNILHQDIPSQALSLPLLYVHSVCSSSTGFYAVRIGYHAPASLFCKHDGNRMETGGEKV
jgi:hypothetical protein